MLLRTGDKTYDVVGSKRIGDDWTHVAGSLDADGRMQVFVDGRPAGAVDGVPMLSGNPMIPMKLGFDDTHQLLATPLKPLSGALDEVLLFHRALSEDELEPLAQSRSTSPMPRDESLVLHLTFDGGKLRDASAAGNHGTFSGGKPVTEQGVVGDALVLRQPKHVFTGDTGKSKTSVAYRWTRDVPIMVRAMALAGDVVWIAGPANLLDEDAAFQNYRDRETQATLAAQDAALKGQSGALLLAISAATGETRAEYALSALPVLDGLIAAEGHLLTSTTDGQVSAWVEVAKE
jgi:hypothetical protein